MESENGIMKDIQYEVILLVTEKNLPVLKIALPYIQRNLGAENIYAIAPNRIKHDLDAMGLEYVDEDGILPGLNFGSIKRSIAARGLDVQRTGWYYQQFLKYAFSYRSKYDYYLTWDADTIPLNPIRYFNEGKPAFIEKKEFHKGYFDTIDVLFNNEIYRVDSAVSFIAENMMFNTHIVKEIIETIESNTDLPGQRFYEKIINAICPENFQSGFSEFETYGNYIKIRYPEMYGSLKLRTLRNGSFFVGIEPSEAQVAWAERDYDIMSIEGRTLFIARLTKQDWFRKAVRLKTIAKGILWFRSARRAVLGLEKLDYD